MTWTWTRGAGSRGFGRATSNIRKLGHDAVESRHDGAAAAFAGEQLTLLPLSLPMMSESLWDAVGVGRRENDDGLPRGARYGQGWLHRALA